MRTRLLVMWTALVAVPLACQGTGEGGGCSGQAGDDDTTGSVGDDDTSADDDTTGDGEPVILYTDPEDGSSDVHYRTRIEVAFTEPVDLVSIELAGDGGTVAGELERDETGTVASFDPYGDDPWTHLEPAAAYVASIAWTGHDPVNLSFSTSDVGLAVDPEDLEGHDYLVDLLSGEFVEPPGVGPLLSQYMGDVFPILHVLAVDDEAGTIEFGLGECEQSAVGEWHNPHLRLGPTTLILFIEGIEAEITDVFLAGDFTPDGSRLVEGSLEGLFDTRFIDVLIDPGAGEGAACDLLESLGIECLPCPSDGEFYCLRMVAEGFVANRI